ncbi:Protein TRIGALACTOSYLDIACYLGLYCEROL 4 chloroplastic [Quillaja saponaria]|uniref:Protein TRIGALACTOSYLDIACYLGLYCEROL 4 chloroplastic n=1 Tax=Quillaja saponaria TaxID=32244 RepID=A0AAD7LPC7_QUISA|nr:Protein TRIGALACTOSYLDIACYLGLYCEROL 4 chloroplastic [Quillaja saponaria]
MANLRTAMDSAFGDCNVSSPQTLEGLAKAVPGDPFPLDGARASKALRIQQLSILGNGFPLGIIPSYSPTVHREFGSFSLQSLLFKPAISDWWLGLIGQFRPKKLISDIKAEFSSGRELELSTFKDVAKHFFDKSLFSIGLCSQFSPTPSSSVLISTEGHGEKKRRRNKMMLFHKLPNHDITLEAAWPQLFVDHKGRHWDVPESISLDLSSLVSESGLRYRFGIQKNSGNPEALKDITGEPPLSLMPGLCAKAAFSYEKKRYIWRQKETREDDMLKTDKGLLSWPSYDVRLREPHAAISGIFGGACTAWLGDWGSSSGVDSIGDGNISTSFKNRGLLNADLFGSVCYIFQHGKFRKDFGDLTRVDARLDMCSASAFAKKVVNSFKSTATNSTESPSASPRLNLIFQQQVAGPIVFRVDARISLESLSWKSGSQVEDLIYSLSYSLRLLQSGKVVAWYSPKRKEGMVELRLFEF